MSLHPSAGRVLYRSILRAADDLQRNLSRSPSLTARELDALLSAASPHVPKHLRSSLHSPNLVKITSSSTSSSSSSRRQTRHKPSSSLSEIRDPSALPALIRSAARNLRQVSHSPSHTFDAGPVAFNTLKHLTERNAVLSNLSHARESTAEKHGIHVGVSSHYQGCHKQKYLFRYHVRILNTSPHTIKLLTRAWTIRDLDGRVTTVHGPGVVGCFPTLQPNQSYEYSSNVPLQTPAGAQSGHYVFVVTEQAQEPEKQAQSLTLQVPVAPFSHRTPAVEDSVITQARSGSDEKKMASKADNSGTGSSAAAVPFASVKPGRRKKRNTDESRRQ